MAASPPPAPPTHRLARSRYDPQLGRLPRPRCDLDGHARRARQPGRVIAQTSGRSPTLEHSAAPALEGCVETQRPSGAEREVATTGQEIGVGEEVLEP